MQPLTNFLSNALRKVTRPLLRDFYELEMLQSSSRGTAEFCNRSFQKVKTSLKEELAKHHNNIIFSDSKNDSLPADTQTALLVYPIEAIDNLSKSLPFFSLVITYLKKIDDKLIAMNSVMLFPVLHELLYTEKGGGSWLEKTSMDASSKAIRLRIVNTMPEKPFIGTNSLKHTTQNIRISGSSCYDLNLLLTSKLDALYVDYLDPILKPGFELFVREAGGFVSDLDSGIVASNQRLIEKIRHQYA
ncbi:MAG: inositol monophosphatase [Rickettsiaceae bacterium]|nr:MAG: inositol monophosphatase [Rickettsiaceae bacterium]